MWGATMRALETKINYGRLNWGVIGVIGAAVAASACCIGPLALLFLGVSGAWISGLSALAPLRPYFTALTIGLLGLAFYLVYREPKRACEPGSTCAHPKSRRRSKATLWVVSILVAGLLVAPYVLPSVFAGGGSKGVANGETVTLAVENMTCGGCAVTIRAGLMKVEGVLDAEVTLVPPEAAVTYDPSAVTVDELTEATGNLGYPSSVKSGNGRDGQ